VIEQHRVHVLLAREVEEHPDREIADPRRLSRLISLTARSCGQKYHAVQWIWESAVSYLKSATAGRHRAWVCHF